MLRYCCRHCCHAAAAVYAADDGAAAISRCRALSATPALPAIFLYVVTPQHALLRDMMMLPPFRYRSCCAADAFAYFDTPADAMPARFHMRSFSLAAMPCRHFRCPLRVYFTPSFR